MTSSMTGNRGFSGQTGSGNKLPSGYTTGRLQQFTPEQMQMFQQMISGLQPGLEGGLEHLSSLASGGTPEMWEQLEAPAMRQFQGLQGQMASRFSGMGTGARRSSGFGNAMSSASSELAEKLQSNRMGLQNNAIQQLMQMSQDLLGQRPHEQFLTKKKPKFWEALLGALSENAGAIPQAFAASQGLPMGG